MGRSTQEEALENRAGVVRAASQLFRERGVQSVSVADVMAEVGLTPGGFYKQFESKDALIGEATEHAFVEMGALLQEFEDAAGGDHAAARADFIDFYLSDENRDDLREGCPAAGLASDIARRDDGDPGRAAYARGVEAFAAWMSDNGRDLDFGAISTMVGALILSRATSGSGFSETILAEAKILISSSRGHV